MSPSNNQQHHLVPQEDLEKPPFGSPSTTYDPHDPFYQEYLEDDSVRKRNIRVLKLLTRLTTLGLATYGVVSQALTLQKYLSTRGIIRDGRNPWAQGTYIWPTLLLLSTSSLTVFVSVATIASYCFFGVKRANFVSSKAGLPVSITEDLSHLAVWIGTAVGYRVGKTGSDLWGWSCDPKANAIQDVFPEVNFSFFCNTQSASWAVSLAQVVLVLVTVMVWIYAWRREKNKKIMRQRMQLDGAY
ncbi:MAG: hypothetical protein LQ340_003692 [Diploschistes diacapsis]|nr:MAG: hypothetical protein LQ340_003692 [Diploschistes diacapsis]